MLKIDFNNKLFTNKYKMIVANALNTAAEVIKIDKIKLLVSVSFLSDSKMKDINIKNRNVYSTTDVLSFPTLLDLENPKIVEDDLLSKEYNVNKNLVTGELFLGDICISISKAKKQAKEFGHGIDREFSYLSIHGFLHLLGYDHENDSDKVVMRMREKQIMAKLLFEPEKSSEICLPSI